jgi:hypothetical protein
VERPVRRSGAVHIFKGTFSFIADLPIDLNMNSFDGFIVGDAASTVKLNNSPAKAHLDLFASGVEKLLFDSMS